MPDPINNIKDFVLNNFSYKGAP